MRRFICIILAVILPSLAFRASANQENIDRVYISELFTTHIVFSTDITYADVSNLKDVAVKIVEQNRNTLALKAKAPFNTKASVTVLESNGIIHTYILEYCKEPEQLVLDIRGTEAQAEYRMVTVEERRRAAATAQPPVAPTTVSDAPGDSRKRDGDDFGEVTGRHVSNLRKRDAPLLKEVIEYPQGLFHISRKEQRIGLTCENIFAYSDITYVVLRLDNESGVSFEARDAMFVIEDGTRGKRKITAEPVSLLPKNRYGSLTAAPGQSARIGYTFEKITLSKDKKLNIYLYEKDGQRTVTLTLTPKDVNLAEKPLP